MAAWQSELARRLTRIQEYPMEAYRQQIHGTVHLRLRAERSGRLTQIAVDRSSGSALLDEAAMNAARRIQPLPRIPCDGPDQATFILPVRFAIIE